MKFAVEGLRVKSSNLLKKAEFLMLFRLKDSCMRVCLKYLKRVGFALIGDASYISIKSHL